MECLNDKKRYLSKKMAADKKTGCISYMICPFSKRLTIAITPMCNVCYETVGPLKKTINCRTQRHLMITQTIP